MIFKRLTLSTTLIVAIVTAVSILSGPAAAPSDFFHHHGYLFLIAIAFVPRLTLIFSAVATGGLIWWLGFFFCPRVLVASLATVTYFTTNPILVYISWVVAISGELLEKRSVGNNRFVFRYGGNMGQNPFGQPHQQPQTHTTIKTDDAIEAEFTRKELMAKKTSDLDNVGIAPNLLLKDIEHTAPWLFKGEIDTSGTEREYLAKLVFYKKNLQKLKGIDLTEYFTICMAAHWSTAGTFVPTNVDNQIRESLWKHAHVGKHIERMGRITIDSWKWNYEQVTNRKSYNPGNGQVMSTHEGTWLSVAIGAYNALKRSNRVSLMNEVGDVILAEIEKEEKLLIELREKRDHVNFLRSTALMAHNFGDLDRVMDQWEMPEANSFRQRIYKLGHQLNENYSPILAYAGQVNKKLLSVENHRHMSMRQAKCLRRSHHFLIPVGPFMDQWGRTLGESKDLSLAEKGEIVGALFEGFKRQDQAYGYARAYRGLISSLNDGLDTLVADIPFDVVQDIRKSKFSQLAGLAEEEFVHIFKTNLEDFECPLTGLKF